MTLTKDNRVGRPPSCTCGECRKCKAAAYMREWYAKKSMRERQEMIARRDPEAVRRNDRRRYERNRDERKERMAEWHRANPQASVESTRAWRKANPEKYRAQTALNNAVRDGRVAKPAECEGCGERAERIEGHHDDYSKPLEVRWLCTACHNDEHRIYEREEV